MGFEVKFAKVFNCFSFRVRRGGDQSVNYKVEALKWGGFRLLIKEEFVATNRLSSIATQSPVILHLSICLPSPLFRGPPSPAIHLRLSPPLLYGVDVSLLLRGVAIRSRIRDFKSSALKMLKMRPGWRRRGGGKGGDGSVTPLDFQDWISDPLGHFFNVSQFSLIPYPRLSLSHSFPTSFLRTPPPSPFL